MIETLEIHNFKSIKDLTLPCKRFNIFIGEPNTGKSNILEALGLVSFVGVREHQPDAKLDGFVRFDRLSNLFFNQETDQELLIKWDGLQLSVQCHDGQYVGLCETTFPLDPEDPHRETGKLADFLGVSDTISEMSTYEAVVEEYEGQLIKPSRVRFFRTPATSHFRESDSDHLLPPCGSNLVSLLVNNKQLRDNAGLPYGALGYRLWVRPHENQIDLARDSEDIVVTSFPYSLASETLQRATFYNAAVKTNRDSVLVFEEPETHSFPHYTGHLAERIALYPNNNQYFIATHNPYFLMSLLEKAGKGQLAINIVYSEDHQTKVKEISASDLPELFELDVFGNLDRYLDP